MSTARQDAVLLGNQIDFGRKTEDGRLALSISTEEEPPEQVIRYARPARFPHHSIARIEPRVLRRMNGFLVELDGADARVAFVENGETILYDLPASHLRKSGIQLKNQPFQMDEIELETPQGLIVGYRFRALATTDDAYIDPLDFDEERKRKRDLILKEFSKTKG